VNKTHTYNIRSLSAAGFYNLVTCSYNIAGQILLGLICWAAVQLPEILLVIAAVISFVGAWLGGQALGSYNFKLMGAEMLQTTAAASWAIIKMTLPGTLSALAAAAAVIYWIAGLEATIALLWINTCIWVFMGFYFMDAGCHGADKESE